MVAKPNQSAHEDSHAHFTKQGAYSQACAPSLSVVTSYSGERFVRFETAEFRLLDANARCLGVFAVDAAGAASAITVGTVIRDTECGCFRFVSRRAVCEGRVFADAIPVMAVCSLWRNDFARTTAFLNN